MNTIVAQLRDLFESMTPAARLTSGLLLVVAVVSIAFLFRSSVSGPDAFLFGGERFSQSEINRMEAAMAAANLSGWKVDSNRISVPTSIHQECVSAIASAGALPSSFSTYMDDALDKASPMESRRQWELRTKTARENQLSLIISHMPWVESAHVMLDIEERRGFNRRNEASASVVVTPKVGEGMDKIRTRNVQQLVAGALSSLTVENVQITSGGNDSMDSGDAWFDDPYLQAREEIQKSYKSRILHGLNFIPGVRVEVSADLENLAKRTVHESAPSDGTVIRSVTENESEDSIVHDGGGKPGVRANNSTRGGLDEGLNRENKTIIARDTTQEESVVGYTTAEEEYQGFKPKELYASIAIPREYVTGIWQQKNPEGDPNELTDTEMQTMENGVKIDVERFVQNILPRLSLGEDEYRQVEVIFIDSLRQPPLPEPSMTDEALAWTGRYWGSLSMLGLAAFSLLLLRSALRASSRDAPDSAALEIDFGKDTQETPTDEQPDESQRPKLRIKKSESLKEDLSEMVREDPDAAANILRSWINNSA